MIRVLFLGIALSFAAADIVFPRLNINGNEYVNAVVTLESPAAARVTHDSGIASVPFSQLPSDLAAKLGMTEIKARKFREQQAAAAVRRASEKQKADRSKELKRIAKLSATIEAVATDQNSYMGRRFIIHGTIETSTYFNYKYAGFRDVAFAFTIRDESGRLNAYCPKDVPALASVRAKLLTVKGPMQAMMTLWINPEMYDSDSSEVHADLLAVDPPITDETAQELSLTQGR